VLWSKSMRGEWICLLAALALGCSGATGGGGETAEWAESGASDGATIRDAGGIAPVDATLSDGTAPDAATGACPELMALVEAEAGPVCIDLYEGALLQMEPDGGETAWPFYEPIDGYDAGEFRAVPAAGLFPQGYINQVQSAAACAASGKRLCSFDEWTAACRGQPEHDYTYPYGDTYEPGWCNEGKESPIVELFGPDPTYSDTELNDPRCDQLEGGLAQGGAYPDCESTYGAFDMHGNIEEWVADSPEGEPDNGIFMGGYFVEATVNGPGCTYETTAHAKIYHDYSTGFRCCADVH